MKLFNTHKRLLTWREPLLFAARTRDRRGWMLKGLLALFIFGVMMLGMFADRNWGGRGPKFSIVGGTLLSAFIGLFLMAVIEAPDLNREATISDDSISSFGNAGEHSSMSTWPLRDVQWVRLIPPEEFGRSFGAMEFQTRKGMARIGVPAKVSMRRIAEVLHSQGIAVTLTGWEPGAAEPTPEAAGNAPPAPSPLPSISARIEPLAEGEAGQIMTSFVTKTALMMAIGPIAFCLSVGLVLCGFSFYEIKIMRVPASIENVGPLAGGVALIVFGFWFTSAFANLVPSLFIRGVARSVIERRLEALFDPRDPEAIYLDVIPRTNWGKAMLVSFSDTGLLKVDELARCLQFEGDKERWVIPAASLVSVEVESYWPAGHVEGQDGGERSFVTVVRANVAGRAWEAPMSKCHVEFRPKGNRLREANAIALRDRIRALNPSVLEKAGRERTASS